jgi:uncharacterized protein YchJ
VAGGWYFLIRDSGGYDASSPEATVRTDFAAVASQDIEMYNRIIHPQGNLPEASEGEASGESPDYTIEEVQVTEQTETQATVQASIIVSGQQGETRTQSWNIELRTADDEWKIYRLM